MEGAAIEGAADSWVGEGGKKVRRDEGLKMFVCFENDFCALLIRG